MSEQAVIPDQAETPEQAELQDSAVIPKRAAAEAGERCAQQ